MADRWMEQKAKELTAKIFKHCGLGGLARITYGDYVAALILRAMQEQREHCAVIAYNKTQHFPQLAKEVAAAIRKGEG